MDGNVLRVFARLYNDDADVMTPATKRLFTRRVLDQMPKATPGPYNEALMELGALVCGKKPRCGACPLAAFCISLHLGIVDQRPVPGKRTPITPIEVVTGVLRRKDRIFVQKRLASGVWGNLWEFPGGRVEPGESPEAAVVREFEEETGFAVAVDSKYGIIRHGYTTYKITLHCFALSLAGADGDLEEAPDPPVLTAASAWRWAPPRELEDLAMPAAHRKLADRIFAADAPRRLPGA